MEPKTEIPICLCGREPLFRFEGYACANLNCPIHYFPIKYSETEWRKLIGAFRERDLRLERAAFEAARACQLEYVENIPCGYGPLCYETFEQWQAERETLCPECSERLVALNDGSGWLRCSGCQEKSKIYYPNGQQVPKSEWVKQILRDFSFLVPYDN
jgi:hypothetical protein